MTTIQDVTINNGVGPTDESSKAIEALAVALTEMARAVTACAGALKPVAGNMQTGIAVGRDSDE